MVVGLILRMTALTRFSFASENVWAFRTDKKRGPNNKVTVREGSTVIILMLNRPALSQSRCWIFF